MRRPSKGPPRYPHLAMRKSLQLSAAVLCLTMSATADGQSSAMEFGQGPAQWLMTADEKKAWRSVKTDEQAREFAELFFVRRDPTPGTYPNEFRSEFNQRVDYADRNFKEPRKRGALTERGRVLVVLGFARNMGAEAAKRFGQMQGTPGSEGADPTGGRQMAGRDLWEYERADAIKFGLPRIEVVFIHDGSRGAVRRDPQRTDFTSALPNAIKYYVKNPQFTTVPDWARAAAVQFASGEPSATRTEPPTETVTTYETVTKQTVVAPAPVAASRPAGAGRLTLVADAFEIQPQSGADPFVSLKPLGVFRRAGELGWAAEYCTGNASLPVDALEVTLKISGVINGQKVNFNSPAEEMVPDQIKAVPGCYLVRGAIPLESMDPGTYTLYVKIGSHNLSKEFTVEP